MVNDARIGKSNNELLAELEDAYERIEELENHIRDGATLLSGDDLEEALEHIEDEISED